MMMEKIWWEQVGSSLDLMQQISDLFRRRDSFVLHLKDPLPWPGYFEQCLLSKTTAYRNRYQYRVQSALEQADPGQLLMDHYSPEAFRLAHWPDDPIARYLCSNADLELHESIFRIQDIHNREQLARWIRFVREYHRYAAELPLKAMFFLEYDGPDTNLDSIPAVTFQIQPYDCHVFCLEAGSRMNGPDWQKEYAAELALRISGTDPELCAALLKDGDSLIAAPVTYSIQVFQRFVHSNKQALSDAISKSALESAVWQAQITLCFPALERRRMELIRNHMEELKRRLPLTNNYGETITSPLDLEVSDLSYIASRTNTIFQAQENQQITFLRTARNELAHLSSLPVESLEKLFA